MTGGSCRIPCDGDLEALLEQLAQMRLDAHVRQHPAQDDPCDAPLAQLQDQVVGLRTEHPVGTEPHREPPLGEAARGLSWDEAARLGELALDAARSCCGCWRAE